MRYKKRKNIIAFLMLQVMVWSLFGCGNIGDIQTEDGEAYAERLVVSDWKQQSINRISFHNDVVYFSIYGEIGAEDGENYCINQLYSVAKDGSNLQEIPIDLSNEEPLTMITSIMISEDNTISIWLSSNDSIDTNPVNVFIKVDSNGKQLLRKDLNSAVNGQYVGKVLETSQGQIIAMAENNVYIFDASLELLKEIDIKGRLIGMALTKEDQILCATEDSDEKKQFQIIDLGQEKVVETVSLKKGESVDEYTLFNASQYDVCYRNDKGIYCYDMKSKSSNCLMSFEKTYLANEDIVDLISVGTDEFMLIHYPQDDTGCSIASYTKPNESAEDEKTMLTFGAFQFDENMKRAVLAFNKTNAEYQITMKEYFNDENGMTADEALENLNKDIAKGEVPDLLDLSVLTKQYVSKGLFEDLTGYMEKSDEFREGVFVDSVFAAMKQEDKLYYISPDFGISTLIGKAGDEGEDTKWSMEELIVFQEQHQDNMLFYADTKIDLLDILLEGSFADFCDWESGECQFDCQEFMDILKFCDDAISKDNHLDANMTKDEAVRQKKVLWIDEANFTPQEIASYERLFGGELAYIGYPKKEEGESYFSFEHQIGICSQSNAKDGAWEFLCMLLSEEYQEQYTDFNNGIYRIPVRQDCFDLLLTKLSNPQDGMEDFEEESDVLSSSQVEAFRSLVADTHEVISYDIEMMNIIEEEAQLYFEGKRDASEAVRFIQERCTTYMNEQR